MLIKQIPAPENGWNSDTYVENNDELINFKNVFYNHENLLKDMENTKLEALFYWYSSGSYEGSGYALGKFENDDNCYINSIGHCSCYGPEDGLENVLSKNVYYKYDLNNISEEITPEYDKEIKGLVTEALNYLQQKKE